MSDSKNIWKRIFVWDCTRNMFGLSTQERLPTLYGENPYLRSNQSSMPQQEPRWTIDLLCGVKEIAESICKPWYAMHVLIVIGVQSKDTASKSQSPPIIDCYRSRRFPNNQNCYAEVEENIKCRKVQIDRKRGSHRSKFPHGTSLTTDQERLLFM